MEKETADSISFRFAQVDDALAIVQIHRDAVHITAAADYDEDILSEWSSLDDGRVQKLAEQILKNPDHSLMLVAQKDGEVIAFGEIVPDNEELRAVYVSHLHGREGVGKALLNELENLARKHGMSLLRLDSSLTAEPFYRSQGYESDGTAFHTLGSGLKMSCVKMHKNL